MPFPFRLRKRPDDADDSDSSQHSSVPTLPPIQPVASNNGDDWFSGSDSGHGESQDETSDATRSEPPRSVVTGSVTSKQASRRPKKHVTIPKSENDDERQPGLIAELEQELAAVEAELAHAPRRGRRQLEQEVEHLKSELNSAREERKRLPGQIEAYEKEVRKFKDREREEAPTGRVLRAFLKLRSADEASDLERIYLRALEQNPHVTANNDSIYGPRTALHRGFHEMMRNQPPREKDPRIAEYNVALQAACQPWYEATHDSKYRLTGDAEEELVVRGHAQDRYKSWLATSRALAKAKSDLSSARTRLDRLRGARSPVVSASPFEPAERASAPPLRSVLKVNRSQEVPDGKDAREYLLRADKSKVPYKDAFKGETKSRSGLGR